MRDDDGLVLRIAVKPEDMDLCVAFKRWRQIYEDLAVGPVTAELLGEVVDQADLTATRSTWSNPRMDQPYREELKARRTTLWRFLDYTLANIRCCWNAE